MDEFSATLMSYAIPLSLAIMLVSGVWLYLKTKLVPSIIFAIGASLTLLNLTMQRFFSTWSASYDDAGKIISMQGPTMETYIFSILGTIGFVLVALSFAFLSYGVARAKNT